MLSCLTSTTFFSVVFLLVSSGSVYGWGFDGHALVARIAQTLLTDESLTFVRDHLPSDTSGNMSMVASWADNILYKDTDPDYLNWQWSKELHYVNTQDWACVYDRQNDCNWNSGRQCVDGAIQNYTIRLADSQQDPIQRQEALQFLIHFIGDVHQPLHGGFEGDRGGNSIRGRFFGTQTNLHSVWDTAMIKRRISQDFHSQPVLYFDYLLNQLKTIYAKNVSDWARCRSSDESRFLACSTSWISESAEINCDVVYRDENDQPMSPSKQFNLGQTYYNTRIDTVQQRLLQAGVRLGTVINRIVQLSANDKKSGWSQTGSMHYGRFYPTLSLLTNGKVLVIGGANNGSYLKSSELYDPSTGNWTITANMNIQRLGHAASILQNGKVLVIGGENDDSVLHSGELYDPSTGTWTTTANMNNHRLLHTASLLTNGKVLVSGGHIDKQATLKSALLYNPSTGTWTTNGNMNHKRKSHKVPVLINRKVLATNGGDYSDALNTAELYDPSTEMWTTTGSMNHRRAFHRASVLTNGKVLVTGGENNEDSTHSTELYDPSTGTWSTNNNMHQARYGHTATVLINGKVLVTGGLDDQGIAMKSAELYDLATGNWTIAGSMKHERCFHTASLLTNGKVLITGGTTDGDEGLDSTELYDPSTGNWTTTNSMHYKPFWHTASVLTNGNVLITGGVIGSTDRDYIGAKTAELYNGSTGTYILTDNINNARSSHKAFVLTHRNV